MAQIVIDQTDPIFPAVLSMLSGDGAQECEKVNPTKSGKKAAQSSGGTSAKSTSKDTVDEYEDMDRDALKKAVRSAGIMKQIRNSYSDDDLREMLRKQGDEDDEEVEDEDIEDEDVEDEEDDDEEDWEDDEPEEDEDEDEVELEIGMQVSFTASGKSLKGKVVAIDEKRGRVKVKTRAGKTHTLKPEAIEL